MLSSVERDDFPNHTKQLEDVQDFTCRWSVDFAMDHERENMRMKEATNELTSHISSLNLGREEMPIEEYVQLAREEIVDVEYNMAELVDFAWGREIHLGLSLNEEPMDGNDLDERPTPIVMLPQAHEYVQLLSNLSILRKFQL